MSELKRSLGLFRGTALMLNIVLGAGLLILPGLAIRDAGDAAFATWLACAAAAVPLLLVFMVLGRRYPDAGGVAHFARRAFGPRAYAIASLLFLGAVALGLPSIALTGGHYASSAFGGSPHLWALGLLAAAFIVDIASVEVAGKISQWLSWVLVLFVIVVAFTCWWLVRGNAAPTLFPLMSIEALGNRVLPVFPLVFFAFTGWEVGANLAEDFRDPARDYPRAMVFSFGMAVGLYALMAYVAQKAALTTGFEAPFATIVQAHLGRFGAFVLALMACTLIFANLVAALWGVSRMIFSLARENLLPARLTTLHHGQPRMALTASTAVLTVVIICDGFGWLRIATLLAFAGQNFFLLYGVAALALLTLTRSITERLLSAIATLIVVAISLYQGGSLLYPACIGAIAIAVHKWQSRTPDVHDRAAGSP